MSLQNLKKAQQFALRGNIGAALPILVADFEKGEAGASPALAEIAAFQGDWGQVIYCTEMPLRHPAAFGVGNIPDEMSRLLAVAALKTEKWQEIEGLARSIKDERMMEKEKKPDMKEDDQRRINDLLEFIRRKGKGPEALGFFEKQWWKPEEGAAKFKNAVATLPERKPKIFKDPDERKREIYALAKTYRYHQGAVDFYLREGLPSHRKFWLGFDTIVFIASGLARVGKAEEAWQLIESKLYHFWPIFYAQMEPVELFFDPYLLPLLTPDRCEKVLKTIKGSEAETKIKGEKSSDSEDNSEDMDEQSLTLPFEFLGATEVKVIFQASEDRMGLRQKASFDALIKKWPTLEPKILKKIFEFYKKNYQDYKDAWTSVAKMNDAELEKFLPSPKKVKDLSGFIVPAVIHIPSEKKCEQEGPGIEFDCTWDEENGLGVLFKDWKVKEVGLAPICYF